MKSWIETVAVACGAAGGACIIVVICGAAAGGGAAAGACGCIVCPCGYNGCAPAAAANSATAKTHDAAKHNAFFTGWSSYLSSGRLRTARTAPGAPAPPSPWPCHLPAPGVNGDNGLTGLPPQRRKHLPFSLSATPSGSRSYHEIRTRRPSGLGRGTVGASPHPVLLLPQGLEGESIILTGSSQ